MKVKKAIINTLIFIFFVTITFYIIFKNNDVTEIFEVIKTVDKRWLIVATIFMSFFVIAEGVNIARTLKLLNCKISFKKGIKYALVGFFFSSVTPSASGGDPMQIYYMKKDGLPIGHSALAILTEFSSFQIVTIIMAIIGFLVNYKFIENKVFTHNRCSNKYMYFNNYNVNYFFKENHYKIGGFCWKNFRKISL